jgi:hypothetical protein
VTQHIKRALKGTVGAILLGAVIFIGTGSEVPTCDPMPDRWGTLHEKPSGYICVDGEWERSFRLDPVEQEIPAELLEKFVKDFREGTPE